MKREKSFRQLIADARRSMREWPKWMRETARFEGRNEAEYTKRDARRVKK